MKKKKTAASEKILFLCLSNTNTVVSYNIQLVCAPIMLLSFVVWIQHRYQNSSISIQNVIYQSLFSLIVYNTQTSRNSMCIFNLTNEKQSELNPKFHLWCNFILISQINVYLVCAFSNPSRNICLMISLIWCWSWYVVSWLTLALWFRNFIKEYQNY